MWSCVTYTEMRIGYCWESQNEDEDMCGWYGVD
jgi:hypothetical protein